MNPLSAIALTALGTTLSISSLVPAYANAAAPDPLAPRPNGMQAATPSRHLIVNATIHAAPGQTFEQADILIDQGRIIAVGQSLADSHDTASATVWDLDNPHIYAGFIDPYIEVDAPMPPLDAPGAHWSKLVTPQRDALDLGLPSKAAENLRKMGFTTAMIAPDSGIFRGWSSIVSTADSFQDPSQGTPPVYQTHSGMMMGFDRGSWPSTTYPSSHMGVVALMRQTFIDAAQRRSRANTNTDASCLDHINPANTTLYYETSHELEALLADNIANEFNHPNLVIIDNGTAHRRLQAFADMGYQMIIPLRFPKTPDVFTVGGADSVDLATLQHHERAPANAKWLSNSRLNVSLTTSKGNDHDNFWDNLHTAIELGLNPDTALSMITTNPANMLGLDTHGSLKSNNIANLVIADGDLFNPNLDAKIIDTWIDGRRHHINDTTNTRFDGDWTIDLVDIPFQLNMSIDGNKITVSSGEGDDYFETDARKVSIDQNQISFLSNDAGENPGTNVITGTLSADGIIRGTGLNPAQEPFQWTATKQQATLTTSDFVGTWDATLNRRFNLTFKVEQADDTTEVTVIEHTDAEDITQAATNIRIEGTQLKFDFEHKPFGFDALFSIALDAPTKNTLTGQGQFDENGSPATFPITAVTASDKPKRDPLPHLPTDPFGPFAYPEIPTEGTYLLTGATLWTQADDGILEDAWVLIRDGKINQIGTGGWPRIGVDESIDASGMHITPGLIDAHSHTGLFRFGVNESGQAVTSEVRIADSIDPAHPGWYRELAGGLTTAMLLHGSANPIGGQSQTVKLRWNSAKPSDMFFENSKPGIKFALGENVKQSNWGDRNTTRYPQTRMGVENLMRDRFTKAREYAQAWVRFLTPRAAVSDAYGMPTWMILSLHKASGYDTKSEHWYDHIPEPLSDTPPMRDLELDALVQILAGDRLIHCHSYRQDEILMLCRLAEEFGFKIGTFQHGLETYKVAETVKEHAIGASIFSDWWAYKVEVTDAIPFAGPINHQVGLLTSYNSDSDDVARRMHVEAAKALKYAKLSDIEMSEQDALNFVTRNPAIQLGIIDRVGTLEVGKDADLVLWTGHPLSSRSRPEMTFVDGRLMFSREMDQQLRAQNAAERQRLIQNILRDGKPPKADKPSTDDAHEHDHNHDHDHDPDHTGFNNTAQGDCGCHQTLPAFHTNY
tara:strand:+ start:33334 stop:36882 length:3549 start_codon:yes stop_codon:yes gene_type:complete